MCSTVLFYWVPFISFVQADEYFVLSITQQIFCLFLFVIFKENPI